MPPPPPPAAASAPPPAAPPPFSAPPPPNEPGTQAYGPPAGYAPAPAGYAPAPAGARAAGYGQAPAGPPQPTTGAEASPNALKRPIGRQIALLILSFGLWGFYWFYDTRKKVNAELGKPDDAGVKTACMLIPIYNIILIYQLWDDLNTLRTRNFGLPDLNVVVLLVVAIFVPFGVFYSYPKVANALNEYWDHRTQGRATEGRLPASRRSSRRSGSPSSRSTSCSSSW